MTFIVKLVLPGLTVCFCIGMAALVTAAGDPLWAILALALGAFSLSLAAIWELPLKTVMLEGDTLVISNYFRRIRVPVRKVVRVDHGIDRGRSVLVWLDCDTLIGRRIRFLPVTGCLFGESPVVLRLRKLAGLGSDGLPA